MKTYTKIVGIEELKYYKIANDINITPRLISFEIYDPYTVEMITERYDCTLWEYMKYPKSDTHDIVIMKCEELFRKLTNINLAHQDISPYNIVVKFDDEDDIFKLIDFGEILDINTWREYTSVSGKSFSDIVRENYPNEKGSTVKEIIYNSQVSDLRIAMNQMVSF